MRRVASTSWIRDTWLRNSSGVFERPALYSGYCSERKVLRETSNATATCVGFSSRRMLINMDVNPYTAFVTWPVFVTKFSAGRA